MSDSILQSSCVAEKIRTACETVISDVFPQIYTGALLHYVTYNYNIIPSVWTESGPAASRYLCQVHFYLPHKEDPREDILGLQRALFDAGFTWPDVTDAEDADGQHWVLECEYADGGGVYGYA